jgi:murein L,D-transpeptidase YafK
MAGEEWERFRHTEAERDGSLAAFWNELQPVFDAFEKERRLPKIEVGPRGEYSDTMVGRNSATDEHGFTRPAEMTPFHIRVPSVSIRG